MEKAIEHFKKIIDCKQFVVTGSYALREIGLTERVKDLDIIIINPTDESLALLEKLRKEPVNKDYPVSKEMIHVEFNDINIDFIIGRKEIDVISLSSGLLISKPMGIIYAKKSYGRLKDLLQLKIMSEMFYEQKDMAEYLKREQNKLCTTNPVSSLVCDVKPTKR